MVANGKAFSVSFVLFGILGLQVEAVSANDNVVGRPRTATITEAEKASALVHAERFFHDPSKLSEKVRTNLHIRLETAREAEARAAAEEAMKTARAVRAAREEAVRAARAAEARAVGEEAVKTAGAARAAREAEAAAARNDEDRVTNALPALPHDGKSHPFTTKNASANGSIEPVNKYPWSAAGKMFMKFGPFTFACTASVIGKNLLVTAAHCIHNYGKKEAGFTDSVMFEPARHGDKKPFGAWAGKEWWIPKSYYDGTDKCSTEAPGTVCENDVAVVVLEKSGNDFIADLTGKFGFKSDEYGYGDLFGNKMAQITQLGYPAQNYDGLTMIRTDSMGYQDIPNNVIIGSAQTGGSSGGPWIMNFGMRPAFSGTQPLADDDNQVVATTSWGFTNDKFMIQGASRFGKNTIYTNKSNIQSLVDSACGGNPGFC